MTPALAARLRVLRAIRHKAGEQLDDAAYRAILQRCAGVASSTQIKSLAKADAVLDEFRRLGIGSPARPKLAPMQKKMWSLWQQLADAGMVNNRHMSGLLGFVRRQTGVDALEWLTWPQEHQIVEALKSWLLRRATPSTDGKADA